MSAAFIHVASADQPALFTERQAAEGAIVYQQKCSACHGPQLEGQVGGYSAPGLRGANFANGILVKDVFAALTQRMPTLEPGKLPRDAYVSLMAFLLQRNGFPAGSRELTYEAAETADIPLLVHDT